MLMRSNLQQIARPLGRQMVRCYETVAKYEPHMNLGMKYGEVMHVNKIGMDVLLDPLYNKGTGFTPAERERLHIRGLVPAKVQTAEKTLELQKQRILNNFHKCQTGIEKYNFITALQDRNETLFYYCLVDQLDVFAPVIYTPTVGAACQQYSKIFRRPRGLYLSAEDQGEFHSMVHNWPSDDVRIIVVTDGSRILGLGDLGANGMGIPVGKLSLYSAAAGIHPARTLPVVLDCGTNNKALLEDPLYIGLNRPRIQGPQFFAIVEEFVKAVTARWPKVFIQFEDFAMANAVKLLEIYQNRVLCFNDDIQGTGCVTVAGIMAALRAAGQKGAAHLAKQRFLICGAGSAGVGVASQLLYAMTHGEGSITEEQALKQFYFMDHRGTLGKGRVPDTKPQARFIRDDLVDGLPLADLLHVAKPTILIGLTGVGALWNEKFIKEMCTYSERPIIMALSNPTANAECTAEQAYTWSNGKAIFASGSPFDPVKINGKTLYTSQANNMFTFPGLGLGAICSVPTIISERMLNKASEALANYVSDADLAVGKLFPPFKEIHKVSEEVAFALCKQAYEEKVATEPYPGSDEALRAHIKSQIWDPHYPQMVPVKACHGQSSC